MPEQAHHICLVGGGHAHLSVLADWIENGLPAERTTLLTPRETLRYSGMVPGWISGQYERDAGLVDVAALAEKAGAHLVLDRCVALNPHERTIETATGQRIDFDLASFDTGGVGRAHEVIGSDPRLLDIRPIDVFVEKLSELASTFGSRARMVVVGGGAGGTELAFALRNMRFTTGAPEVILVAGADDLLPDQSAAVRAKVAGALKRQSISLIEHDAQLEGDTLAAGGRSLEPFDLIVAAVGSGAPDWAQASGLACDADGFIAVDRHQRSTSHSQIFAVGDVAARQDREVAHSGVHAVMAGPALAANLRAAARGDELAQSYQPRWTSLYLMSTGDGSAIASYGPFAAEGRWVSKLKNWIDTRWTRKYARLGGKL